MFECLETGPRHEVGEFISDVIFQTYSDVNVNSSEKMVFSSFRPQGSGAIMRGGARRLTGITICKV